MVKPQQSTQIVPYKVSISDRENYNEVLESAIANAKEEALRKAGVPENISSYSSLAVLETNNSFEEVFNSEIFSDISGAVTSWKYLEEPVRITDKTSGLINISFTIEAVVKKYETKKDPSFKAKVQGMKSSYKDGDYIDFDVTFYMDAFINVFYLSAVDGYTVLYPIEEDKRFANKLYKKSYNKKFDYLEAKTKLLSEYGRLLIVITKAYYPYVAAEKEKFRLLERKKKEEEGYIDGLSSITDLESIWSWLFSIEPENRDEYVYEFIISKKD